MYLPASNSEGGEDADYIDRYIKKTSIENQDFEVISTELWEFLKARYSYDFEVKRYYQKASTWSYQTSLEVRLKLVPVVFVFTDSLMNDTTEPDNYQTKYI